MYLSFSFFLVLFFSFSSGDQKKEAVEKTNGGSKKGGRRPRPPKGKQTERRLPRFINVEEVGSDVGRSKNSREKKRTSDLSTTD
jgi:hypothetical protein